MLSRTWYISVALFCTVAVSQAKDGEPRQILMYGGNGLLGAPTVERFLNANDNVTLVSRGNWYWDTEEKLERHVTRITCDRTDESDDACSELKSFVDNVDMFDAVIDFSAYSAKETKDAAALLKGKSKLYILISTDSVYDVCDKNHDGPTKEVDGHRPADEAQRDRLNYAHTYGHRKLQAEDELIKYRRDNENGIPYVILRLPDVIGPRDTTYRWWVYQLWVKLAAELQTRPVTVPHFLEEYPLSFVFSLDVADLIYNITHMTPEIVNDEIFNIADSETFTLRQMIAELQKALAVDSLDIQVSNNHSGSVYLYPTVRGGPLDVTKASEILDWTATPFEKVVEKTVGFYEEAMTSDRYNTQRDEIIQILTHQLYQENTEEFYKTVEFVYNITLKHFRHDEL